MFLVAYVLTVTMLGTTLPTPLYPEYERQFGFGELTATVVFATYALGVLLTLVVFGQASDLVGRRPVLGTAVAMAALSTVVFIGAAGFTGAGGVALLLVGRLLSGLSGGMATGTAAAALTDLAPPDRPGRASLVAAMAQIGGLGLGPLLGGVLAQYLDSPLRTVYVVYLGLLVVAGLAVVWVPETVTRGPVRRLATPLPARSIAAQVTAAGVAGFCGFAVLGLFSSVSPVVLADLGWHAPVTAGLLVCSVFAASALGQLATARVSTTVALVVGIATLTVGTAAVGGALHTRSTLLLVLGGLVAGAGQGMSFRAALASVTAASSPQRRGEAASSFFVVCYLGLSVPVVGVGALSRAFGLITAGEVFAAIITVAGVVILVRLANRSPRTVKPART